MYEDAMAISPLVGAAMMKLHSRDVSTRAGRPLMPELKCHDQRRPQVESHMQADIAAHRVSAHPYNAQHYRQRQNRSPEPRMGQRLGGIEFVSQGEQDGHDANGRRRADSPGKAGLKRTAKEPFFHDRCQESDHHKHGYEGAGNVAYGAHDVLSVGWECAAQPLLHGQADHG